MNLKPIYRKEDKMSYPKPLSEKSIERLYKQSGLSEESPDFLNKFFSACANLYGIIELRHVWEVFKALEDKPNLRRKDIVEFAKIARREVKPYYIYKFCELFIDEVDEDLNMFIVSEKLVGRGYGKHALIYILLEERHNKPYAMPKDFLSYAKPVKTQEEINLFNFISNLKSTAKTIVIEYKEEILNKNKGKKLNKFSFLNRSERFEIDYAKRESEKEFFRQKYSGTEAEKIMRKINLELNLGKFNPLRIFEMITEELSEVGVELTVKQIERLTELFFKCNNNTRMWCQKGWKPSEQSAKLDPNNLPTIALGPGIKEAIKDGSIDLEELVKGIREQGFEVDLDL